MPPTGSPRRAPALTVLAPVATLGTISDAGLVMGARAWFFLRSRPGELRPLAQSVVDDFFFRAGRLPTDAEGFVRYAEVIVHTAWRNGPVEDVHAGGYHGYPLDQRRVTPADERELMAFVSERVSQSLPSLAGRARSALRTAASHSWHVRFHFSSAH